MRLVATLWSAGVATLFALVLVTGVACSNGNGNGDEVIDANGDAKDVPGDIDLEVGPDVDVPELDVKDTGKDEPDPDVVDIEQDQDNVVPPDEIEPDEVEQPTCLYPCQNSADCEGKIEGESFCKKALCLPDETCAGVNPDSPKQCKLVDTVDCCDDDKECIDENECTINEKCVDHSCTEEFDPNNPDCCVNNVLLKLDFENIQVGEMPPADKAYCTDKQPGDNVLCSVQPAPCGGKAVYFGDPICKTYNSGQMVDCQAVELMECTEETQDEDCPPPKADCDSNTELCIPSPIAARVTFELVAPEINLPESALLQLNFRFFIDAEFQAGAELNFDTLDVIARVAGGGGTDEELVYTSVTVENSTKGKCLLVAADLTKYAGKSVDLIWRFDTFDGTSNLGQGVYIDDISVSTFCLTDLCLAMQECDDDNVCTLDDCGLFVNKGEGGVCINEQADPDCKECATVDDCQVKGGEPIDPCTLADCVPAGAGKSKCVWSPNPDCCTQDDLGQYGKQGFESGDLPEGWTVEAQPNSPIKWAAVSSQADPNGGDVFALAFGAGSYDCGQNHCWGKVTSGKFDLTQASTKAFVKLTFMLRMGTEWDKVDPSEYLSAGIDTLTVSAVLENGDAVEVWSSDVLFGTTGYDQNPGGQVPDIQPVWADLTQFAGQKIQLRFEFDTGDVTPPENDYFGVLIDELTVDTVCEEICLAAADCVSGGDCTKGKCIDGICAYDPIPECCTQIFNPKCDDKDPCTDDQCDLGAKTCTHQFNGAPNCCTAKEQVFYDNFDADPSWMLIESGTKCGDGSCEEPETCTTCPSDCAECKVRWQVVNKQAFTPEYSLFFGNTASWTYDNGQNPAFGKITSPAFKLPPYGVPIVSFMLWLETEHSALFVEPADFDKLTLFVEWADKVDSPTWSKATEVWNSLAWDVKGNTDGWKKIEVGLKKLPVQGKAVRFTFEFNSFDAFNNGFGGAYVDDFKTKTICNDTYACASAFECAEATPDNPHCSIEQCTAGACLPVVNPLKDGCCVQEVLPIKDGTANFDFEPAGMDGWKATPPNATVMWQYSETHPCGGKGALWFGNKNTGDYSDPAGKAVKGTVCSPDVNVTGMGSVELSFCFWADLKDPFHWLDSFSLKMDSALFAGGDPIGVKKELWHKPCSESDFECADPKKPEAPCNLWGCDGLPMQVCTCEKIIVDLSAYNWVPGVDHRAVFCFDFDSGDGAGNKGAGVFLDDVQVKTLCQ